MSALIFVALAVAWAAYLIPIALKHHDEAVRSRSVDRFSDRMRVLARREPVDRRNARLVVTPGRPASMPVVVTKPSAAAVSAEVAAKVAETTSEPQAAPRPTRREAARRAARRRRRVLGLLLVANAVVITLAALHYFSWWYVAIPAGLVVAWLVLCRVMVRRERRARASFTGRPVKLAEETMPHAAHDSTDGAEDVEEADPSVAVADPTEDIPVVATGVVDPALWEPLPVTLPTYVTKPAARRSVRTIDLDSTGVWTSGRTEADAKLARQADEDRAQQAKTEAEGDEQRAVGS